LPASRLPYVYIAIAALAVVVAWVNRNVTRRFSRRGTLAATLVVSAFTTAGFWFWTGGSASLYAFYVWTGILATVAVVQLWLAIADEWDATLAKRAFAVVGAGGLVGATAGSAAAGALLGWLEARDLILVAAGILLAAGGASALVLPQSASVPARPPRRRPDEPVPEGLWSNPYLRRLLLLVTATQIAVTSADLLFKAVVAHLVPGDDLGSFFAIFYTGLNGLSLVVQLLLASWLLRRLGVNRALWVLPVLLGIGALGFALTAALVPILIVKVVDGSLRHSLHRTGIELLYLPLPARLRDKHKVTIDAVGARGGQAIASLAFLGAMGLGLALTDLALIVTGAVAILLTAVIAIKHHYVELFRAQLREGSIETRAEVPELDLHSLEALIAGLSSPDERVVMSAMDLLAQSGRANLLTPLILYHPSREVVVRALEVLSAARRIDFLPLARRLLKASDPDVRTAALRAVAATGGEEAVLREALADPAPAVRATAIVGIVASCCDTEGLRQELREVLESPDPESRLALARAIRHRPGREFHPVLRALAGVAEPALMVEVARTMAASPDPSFVPLLLSMLADRRARPEARTAMVAMGQPALEQLDRALGDPSEPLRLRLHVPRTISKFATQSAADVLCRHLERELHTTIGYKILRGLGRMIVDNPRIQLDGWLLDRSVAGLLIRAITLVDWRVYLEAEMASSRPTTAGALLVALLREKQESCAEKVFRLLGMRHSGEDFHAIWQGLRSEDRKSAASGRELLEHLIEPPARAALLALIDRDIESDAERLKQAAVLHVPDFASGVARLRAMMDDASEALAGLAAHHVAEIGVMAPELDLDAAMAGRPGRWTEALEAALQVLRGNAGVPSAG
jgi:AAA family ATP:ADP antiporter